MIFSIRLPQKSIGAYRWEGWHGAPKKDDTAMFEGGVSEGLLKRKHDGDMLML